MLKQLSIYAENKKGNMQKLTSILEKEQINIWGSVTNDSAEYGIIRMVVSDAQKAMEALTAGGYMCKLTDVIGVEMEDEVGNLNKLLGALSDSNININYIYLSFNRESGKPVLVFHAEEIGEVEDCIVAKGFCVV
jgi:hypothetical protein